ncbi:MAG TPA: ABC transporter ATP-binding protein [Candidatus Limnocylindria bacterium]|nr:ABC transporter ATP-binding protein [Candidatus Limnocylindria bacterium]
MLEIRNLTKKYGDKTAVDNLSLSIAPGEIYGFIGHNGAGKTTTIKAACGILDFDAGDIRVGGLSIREKPLECKRMLAYLPDNPDLYEFMSGVKYLGFVADVFGIPAKARRERIEKYADLFSLRDDLAQPIGAYSHGMKQKLALIAALIHEPRLLIMDEPFTGLDPKASFLLKQEMRRVCDAGGAVFFSTHVLDVAEKLCDKVAILRQGRLVVSGPTREVRGDDSLEEIFLELVETP